MPPPQPTLSDRFLAAAIAITIMGLMVAALPLALGVLTRGNTLVALTVYLPIGRAGSPIVIVTAITAFLLGTERSVVLFGHLWGTEEPRNLRLTLLLWAALALVGLIGVRLFPG